MLPTPDRNLRLAAAVALATLAAPACVSTTPYARLATAGGAYAGAVESLTGAAGALAVDSSSARLLQDDALANVDLATLRRFDEQDAGRLEVLARLATHARLMRRYFMLLGDLAAGRTGRSAISALDRLATAIDGAGNLLRGSDAGAGAAAAVGPVRLGAALYGRSLARSEVAARAPALRRELSTQREVLAALAAAMRHDARILAETRRQRLVVDPLLAADPVADPERWISDRRQLLGAAPALAELDAATHAADVLVGAIGALAAGRVDLDRLDEVIGDAEAIIAALDAIGLRRKEAP